MQHGYQCGMIWGSALAAGARAYHLFGTGTQAETGAIMASQRLVESFRILNKHTDCIEITGIDKSSSALQMTVHFFIKGGTIDCIRMATKYAPVSYADIDSVLSENHFETAALPSSCSAIVARKMGASDMHTVMAAGLAGGIGLSGGACGALGAAIWIHVTDRIKAGADKIEFMDPKAMAIVSKFVKSSGFEFECSKIVGRKFEDVHDHAAYLRDGGCSKIIGALSSI